MPKTVVQSFSAHLARFSPTRCVGIFPCCARGLFRSLRERERFCSPLFFFSLPEKEERPAGVEEKEGFSLSVCPATPTGAVRLFAKHCFSCGLRPKAAAAKRRCTSILWHLSRQSLCVFARAMLSKRKAAMSVKVSNHFQFPLWRIIRMCIFSLSAAAPWAKQYLPHPLAAAALLVERMRKNFQIAAQTMTKNLSMRSSPKHRKAAASPLFLCTGRLRPQARFGAQPSAARLLARRCALLFLAKKKKRGLQKRSRRFPSGTPYACGQKKPPCRATPRQRGKRPPRRYPPKARPAKGIISSEMASAAARAIAMIRTAFFCFKASTSETQQYKGIKNDGYPGGKRKRRPRRAGNCAPVRRARMGQNSYP